VGSSRLRLVALVASLPVRAPWTSDSSQVMAAVKRPMAGAVLIADDTRPSGPPGDERERSRLRALVRARPQGHDPAAGLEQLCRVAVGELRVSGAVVSLMTLPAMEEKQSGTIAAASSDWARSVEELEFSHGEGPGNDAFLTSRPVLTTNLELAFGRWPGYASAALVGGSRATFAFPMLFGASRFGVLHLHCSDPRSLTGPELATSLLLTELATEIVLDGFLPGTGQGLAELPLFDGVDSRDQIYQAQGMVMVQLGISLPAALARLRAHAYASNQELAHLAADIVAGRARLSADPEGAQ
jgi:hypothetical protein